ncbi:MAG TPA: hypothetical protein EYH34_02780 [Planctomycetes bacterium]|nr:hypothetical protein [Planctomycetota bacterium]
MTRPAALQLTTPAIPPDWALWQRHLMEWLYSAATEFVDKYTRDDGTLIWRERWPGMDGSDDGYESFYNFALYYALGGPAPMHGLSRKLWEAVTRQFTRYGQIYREFDGYYDWMHHGESYTYFYFFGLADPRVPAYRQRAVRFAAMYTGEDPEAPNYDPQRKMIRSPINGSRGPRFVTTAEDWVTHRPVLADYPLPFDDIPQVTSSQAWIDDQQFPRLLEAINGRMMRGDVPLNLTATSLVVNAYLYTGEAKYKRWVEEYVEAWIERTRRNDGILPDNIGPHGVIGERMDGKWWGGYYGWRWPHGLFNLLESTLIGASNAYLLSGDPRYLQLPRSVVDVVGQRARRDAYGRVVVPHRHGDQGWYDYRPINPTHLVYLWHISQSDEDRRRLEELAEPAAWDTLLYDKGKGDWEHAEYWMGFIEGRNRDYPEEILQATYAESLRRLGRIRNDRTTPDEQDVHHWQQRNPVVLEGIVQTALGAPNHIYHGGLLHVRLFPFDPAERRPGLPPDTAILVDRLGGESLSLVAVNLHPGQPREVILQAGAFGEHRFVEARHRGQVLAVNDSCLTLRLSPGAVGRVDLALERFAAPPRYAFPWQ